MEEQSYNPFGKIGSGAPNMQFGGPNIRKLSVDKQPEQ